MTETNAKTGKPRVGIIGYFAFPFGSAGASRIRNISKGLLREGSSVTVITQARCEGEALGTNSWRYFDGIEYRTTYETTKPGAFSVVRRVSNLSRSITESALLLKKLIASQQIDAVIVYALTFQSVFPVLKACREINIPVITDVVEWVTPDALPWRMFNPQFLQIMMKRSLLDPRFSGATVISSYLYEQYSRLGYPVLRIPALYNFEEVGKRVINCAQKPGIAPLKLVFVGGNKPNDGLDVVLDALQIGDFGPLINLNVIGNSTSDAYVMQLRTKVDCDPKLKESVAFLGKLSHNGYLSELADADVLLLTRRDNIMARAAFPTRLPEFLATGKPVITTSIPDVPEYLMDNEHAFVVDPGRADLLAEKIALILKDRALAAFIGQNGREQARRLFDYRVHASHLAKFIAALQ